MWSGCVPSLTRWASQILHGEGPQADFKEMFLRRQGGWISRAKKNVNRCSGSSSTPLPPTQSGQSMPRGPSTSLTFSLSTRRKGFTGAYVLKQQKGKLFPVSSVLPEPTQGVMMRGCIQSRAVLKWGSQSLGSRSRKLPKQ